MTELFFVGEGCADVGTQTDALAEEAAQRIAAEAGVGFRVAGSGAGPSLGDAAGGVEEGLLIECNTTIPEKAGKTSTVGGSGKGRGSAALLAAILPGEGSSQFHDLLLFDVATGSIMLPGEGSLFVQDLLLLDVTTGSMGL